MLETLDQYKQYYAVNYPTKFACMEESENKIGGPNLSESVVAALRQAKASYFDNYPVRNTLWALTEKQCGAAN